MAVEEQRKHEGNKVTDLREHSKRLKREYEAIEK